jgi:ABC-type antimicrobial peptide transport system permease subunit
MLSTLALAVLFVACANVASLLTSRAPARAREMALRLAIGAGRGRLVRQLVTESLLLAIAGGIAGLGVGYAGMTLFRQIELPTDLPIALAFRMDRRALLFSLMVAIASAVIFGLVPGMRAISVFNVLVITVASLGLMGLGLSIVGLYGLVAYAVSRRTREIGIRMAIGADRAVVLRMVLRQGLVLAVVGLLLGLVASVGAGALLQAAFPSGGNDRDPVALLIVIPIVLAVTFLAAYLPARRASRVNPVQALRYE